MGMEARGPLPRMNILPWYLRARSMQCLAEEEERRSIDCIVECGDDPCRHWMARSDSHQHENTRRKEGKLWPSFLCVQRMYSAESGLDRVEKGKPNGAQEASPQYSPQKRCNCLSHQRQAQRPELLLEEQRKVRTSRFRIIPYLLTPLQQSCRSASPGAERNSLKLEDVRLSRWAPVLITPSNTLAEISFKDTKKMLEPLCK